MKKQTLSFYCLGNYEIQKNLAAVDKLTKYLATFGSSASD